MHTSKTTILNVLPRQVYAVLCFLYVLIALPVTVTAQKISFEDIKSECRGSSFESRVRLTVARFSVSTLDAQNKFGGELATMLSNGLQQTNCFRVLESISNANDLTGEIAFGQSGMTNGSSSPESGKMLGAQVVVTGEVTEYNEGQGGLTLGGFSVGTNKARLGFILKIVNPATREILFSESINVIGRKNGLSGLSLGRIGILGSNTQNKAFSNAIEQAILQACAVLVDNKDMIPLPEANSGVEEIVSYNSSNCSLLGSAAPPSVMIIVPEVHIQRPIPDPAGETEIIRRFIESGFKVLTRAFTTISVTQKR